MSKLINLIPNSSFEEFEYINGGIRPNTIQIKNWDVSSEDQINGVDAYNGGYSMSLKESNAQGGSSLMGPLSKYNPKHRYYYKMYHKGFNGISETFTITLMKSLLLSIKSYSVNTVNDNEWHMYSTIIDPISSTANPYEQPAIWFKQSTNNSGKRVLIDSLLLVDLTEAFGEGYEPSNEWCDKNIPYFEKEYDIMLLPKEIEFTCKDQFIFDENTKKHYTNTYSPKITFVVKNVDKNYNLENKTDLINKIRFDYTSSDNKSTSSTVTEKLTYDNLDVEFKDNKAYCTFNGFSFLNTRHHAKLEIYSDLSNGTRVKDEMTIYFVGKYDNFEYNLDYNLSYASTYLRKLKGTTNAYDDVPMNIDVFINGVKTSPVNILNQDDKLTTFEKDLYLSDGNNVIKVVVTDICGNTKSKTTEIFVDCMTPMPEKEDLLTNFVADDDLKISLHLGNADLKYETKAAGMAKDVLIDTSIASHYFKLDGENSNLYRISKDQIPKIQGDIIKRPLSVLYDYVEKIYDGTNNISDEVRKLKLDNGYYLRDVHKEYNDYAGTGLVRGTFERKVTSDTIFKPNEYIDKDYIIDKPNVDFTNVYINVDGIEGYSLYDENSDTAQFIFQNDLLDFWFKDISLIRNNNQTIVRFALKPNNELLYKVTEGVNIKYNYSNNSGSEYLTYKSSDVGLVQVDFNNAFFESKDVTDEIQSITINDIKFVGDVLGDASNNYQIANYSSMGKILRRTINPHIQCLDKIYDGSPIVPIIVDDEYYNGLENSISGDDVYLDTTYEGDKDSETHIFTKNGSTVFTFSDSDVGENKIASLNAIFLEGHDAKNYKIGDIISNYQASILLRPIEVIINKIRFIRATKQWEIDYTIKNDIKSDKLTISYNTQDDLDIKVYGGIDNNDESIHNNYGGKTDIITMFFDYPFNLDYQFSNIDTEVKKVSNDTTTAYWRNEARPAEPDSERMDVITEVNTEYPGEIKFALDTLSNGVQTPYFESENKDYKLYSGCKVMVTNLNLSPLNNKSKNYSLLNSTCETEIEII